MFFEKLGANYVAFLLHLHINLTDMTLISNISRKIAFVAILVSALPVMATTNHDIKGASFQSKTVNLTANMTGNGVDRELADFRKGQLTDLRYDLSFNIPRDRNKDVKGDVTISFYEAFGAPVVIDFKGKTSQVLSVKVNGKKCNDYIFKNEHIVIPSERINKGDNRVSISFVAGNSSLNRKDEFLYTLLVPDRARTLFPCFDQPNLKAEYSLKLEVPDDWVAVSNTAVKSEQVKNGRRTVCYMPTEPLSTYLFSFVAGKFNIETRTHNGRTISSYYRETDPEKISQFDTIFRQVFNAIDWLEDYTDSKFPFAKYDFIILPGFQFGGMEHTGATLYNDRMLFLNSHPTPEEELSRSLIIAHETAHMWFGDLVTMNWFDDVWTKEVFANYYAAVIGEPEFPNMNHRLHWLRSFYTSSLDEDRTDGTTAIQQSLNNLQDAGLIYGNIVYNKAPVMMLKMVDIMGEDAFRDGIREYLRKYAYDNATWDDLIEILDKHTNVDLKSFSNTWVKEKGMPIITTMPTDHGFHINQSDKYGRDLVWQQKFDVLALSANGEHQVVTVNLADDNYCCELPFTPDVVIPNVDGSGYAGFVPDEHSLQYMIQNWSSWDDEVMRQTALMTIYENYLNGNVADIEMLTDSLLTGLEKERNLLIASSVINYITYICNHLENEYRQTVERRFASIGETHPDESSRLLIMRRISGLMSAPDIVANYYNKWDSSSETLFGESDYMTLSYELAVRLPDISNDILSRQRARISNPDRLQQFDYISRACTPDTAVCDSLFNTLRMQENRLIEPYAGSLLYYINHPVRDLYAVKYIRPSLEMLQEIQRTGDIFFPTTWLKSLLSGHYSKEARHEVEQFLTDHPDYPSLLRNKVLQSSYHLSHP
jgi:aminopeptidase N